MSCEDIFVVTDFELLNLKTSRPEPAVVVLTYIDEYSMMSHCQSNAKMAASGRNCR